MLAGYDRYTIQFVVKGRNFLFLFDMTACDQ
jgi:hypothetical protein